MTGGMRRPRKQHIVRAAQQCLQLLWGRDAHSWLPSSAVSASQPRRQHPSAASRGGPPLAAAFHTILGPQDAAVAPTSHSFHQPWNARAPFSTASAAAATANRAPAAEADATRQPGAARQTFGDFLTAVLDSPAEQPQSTQSARSEAASQLDQREGVLDSNHLRDAASGSAQQGAARGDVSSAPRRPPPTHSQLSALIERLRKLPEAEMFLYTYGRYMSIRNAAQLLVRLPDLDRDVDNARPRLNTIVRYEHVNVNISRHV